MAWGETQGTGVARLRVLQSLPRQHQAYLFGEIRKLCTNYLASLSLPTADRESVAGELFSEVMAKLLGVGGAAVGGDDGKGEAAPYACPADDDPKRDCRVAWLLSEVGGRQALAHRLEDMRRQRHGRWREGGYRTDQLVDEHVAGLSVDPDEPHDERDTQRVWQGVLVAAASAFEPGEDVYVLLELMAGDAEIQAAFGPGWPVRRIVGALNRQHPGMPWNDDRVENAKRRLTNWIARLQRDRGLDQADLKDLFAGLSREAERRNKPPPLQPPRTLRPSAPVSVNRDRTRP
jgi:hypothetical protein